MTQAAEPRPNPAIDQLLRPEEAARLLAMSRSNVWRLISDGSLRSLHVGRLRRIPTSAVAEYIADRLAVASDLAA